MNLHNEVHFEQAICDHIAAHGWLYAEGDAEHYDRTHGLYLADLLAWIQTTQPESWQALGKSLGSAVPERIAERVRDNTGSERCADARDHGCAGSAQQHEHPGAGVRAGAQRVEGHPAGASAALRSLEGQIRSTQWLSVTDLGSQPSSKIQEFGAKHVRIGMLRNSPYRRPHQTLQCRQTPDTRRIGPDLRGLVILKVEDRVAN
jgi:hypothetical protein